MKITDQFRKDIKAYLKANRMRAYELARKAHVPQACIYDFLRQKRGIRMTTADKIGRAMK